jgi:hypothetical protein
VPTSRSETERRQLGVPAAADLRHSQVRWDFSRCYFEVRCISDCVHLQQRATNARVLTLSLVLVARCCRPEPRILLF